MTRRVNHRARRWTPEDEDILIDEIGKNPTCMKACFLAAAARLGRGPAGVSNHWYKYMANREDVCAKLTLGRHSCVRNRTRLKADQQPTSILRSLYDGLINMIFGRNNQG